MNTWTAIAAPEPTHVLGTYFTLQEARDAFGPQTWHPTLEGYVNAAGTIALHRTGPAA